MNVDRDRTRLLSDVVLAANKRLGTDNLYAKFGGTEPGKRISVGYLHKGSNELVGNTWTALFETDSADEAIEFVKGL